MLLFDTSNDNQAFSHHNPEQTQQVCTFHWPSKRKIYIRSETHNAPDSDLNSFTLTKDVTVHCDAPDRYEHRPMGSTESYTLTESHLHVLRP